MHAGVHTYISTCIPIYLHTRSRYIHINLHTYLPTYALEVSMVASRPALDNRNPAGKQEVRLTWIER